MAYECKRLDHLGIVAGACQEIGLAAYLDGQEPQFFEHKPLEHLLGPGIKAEDLNDDCLGRALDWLYEHDMTRLFAGIARKAREKLGITSRLLHVDTTSFSRRRSLWGAVRGRGSDQHHVWLFTRSLRRCETMDVGTGDHTGLRSTALLASVGWQQL